MSIDIAGLFDRQARRATTVSSNFPNAADFNQALRQFCVQVQGNLEETVRNVVTTIDDTLVAYNPVDTGYSRLNWRPSVGAPVEDTIGEKIEGAQSTDGEPTRQEVKRMAAQWHLGDATFWLTNSVDYIGALNAGSSKQAEAGWVETAVQNGLFSAQGKKVTP